MSTKKSNILNVAQYKRIMGGHSLTDMSHMTSIPVTDIAEIEKRNFSCGVHKLRALAQYNGITIDALVNNDFQAILPTLTCPANKTDASFTEAAPRIVQNGLIGEHWVFLQEKERLKGTPYENAVNPNYADEPGARFDIMSFTEDGAPILIEVKSTNKNASIPFQISPGEIAKAKECLDKGMQYEVHRVYHVDDTAKIGRRIISAEELLSRYELVSCKYMAKRRAGR